MSKTIRVTFTRDHFHRLSDRSDTTYQDGGTYDLPADDAREHINAGVATTEGGEAKAPASKGAGRGKADV
jgi:hypothetical protein